MVCVRMRSKWTAGGVARVNFSSYSVIFTLFRIKQGVENDQVVFRFWTERKLEGAVLDVFMLFGVAVTI